MMYGKGAGPVTANAIVFDLGLLLNECGQAFVPKGNIKCNANSNVVSKYLIKPYGNIDSSIVEKKIGSMILTKEISGEKLNSMLDDIEFYARIFS